MDISTLSSTFFLTLLLAIGLFFFIRASVKDRTEVVTLVSEQPQDFVLEELQQYFTQRAYRVISVDAPQQQVVFEGVVQPSLFLAIFLSLLMAVGIGCLVLVLAIIFPGWTPVFSGLLLLSPLAGLFYWRGAKRPEKVTLKVEPSSEESGHQSKLTVTAHRDEVIQLRQSLSLRSLD